MYKPLAVKGTWEKPFVIELLRHILEEHPHWSREQASKEWQRVWDHMRTLDEPDPEETPGDPERQAVAALDLAWQVIDRERAAAVAVKERTAELMRRHALR